MSAAAMLRAAALLLLCASAACFSVRYSEGSQIPHERVKDLVPGVTTRAQVLEWFGAPETFSNPSYVNKVAEQMQMKAEEVLQLPFSDSMVFRFTKGRLKGRFLGIWNQVDVQVTADTLVVFFDEQDRVSSYGYRRGTDDLEKPGKADAKVKQPSDAERAEQAASAEKR